MPAPALIGAMELLVLLFVVAMLAIPAVVVLAVLWMRQRDHLARSGPIDAMPIDPWQRLRAGMTEAEVTRVLGPPARVEPTSSGTEWRYGTAPAEGTIVFADGRLVGFRKPGA